jgi:hypothetical protein
MSRMTPRRWAAIPAARNVMKQRKTARQARWGKVIRDANVNQN